MEIIQFSYDEIHQTVKKTCEQVSSIGYEPDYILAVGGGGFIPARILRCYMKKPILAVSLMRYNDNGEVTDTPRKLQWTEGLPDLTGKKVLVVDEVDDCRNTIIYCIDELAKEIDAEFSLFVLHNKLKEKVGDYPKNLKHVFIGKDLEDKWIKYPWDIV